MTTPDRHKFHSKINLLYNESLLDSLKTASEKSAVRPDFYNDELLTVNTFLLLTLLVMMTCATYQVLRIVLKLIFLVATAIVYITYSVYMCFHSRELKIAVSNEDTLLRFITDSIFLVAFLVALIFHSHQTEATYRLDFIWKLQATGMFKQINTFNTD